MDQQAEDRVRLFVETATWIMAQAALIFPQSYYVDRPALAAHLGVPCTPAEEGKGQSQVRFGKARGIESFEFYVGAVITTLAAEGFCVNAHSNEVGLTLRGLEKLRTGTLLEI